MKPKKQINGNSIYLFLSPNLHITIFLPPFICTPETDRCAHSWCAALSSINAQTVSNKLRNRISFPYRHHHRGDSLYRMTTTTATNLYRKLWTLFLYAMYSDYCHSFHHSQTNRIRRSWNNFADLKWFVQERFCGFSDFESYFFFVVAVVWNDDKGVQYKFWTKNKQTKKTIPYRLPALIHTKIKWINKKGTLAIQKWGTQQSFAID